MKSESDSGSTDRGLRRFVVAVVVGLVLLRAFFAIYPVYLPTGASLAAPFPDGWKGIPSRAVAVEGAGADAVARLTCSSNALPTIEYPIGAVADIDAIQVRARCSAEELVRGQSGYHVGRVVLAFVDGKGKSRWDWPHAAGAVDGTQPWTMIARRFVVPEGAVSARMMIHNYGRSGVLAVRDVEAVPMLLNPWTPLVFALWGLAWGACAWIATTRLGLLLRPGGRAVMMAALAIVVGMLLPERALSGVAVGVRHVLTAPERKAAVAQTATATTAPPVVGKTPATTPAPRPDVAIRASMAGSIDLHKAGHFVVFAWLTLAAAACFGFGRPGRRRGAVAAGVGGLVLFAFAAEQLQWLTLTRNAKLADIAVNLVGIAAGLLLAEVWRGVRRRRAGLREDGPLPAG